MNKKTSPILTVLIPVYNAAKTVADTIDSILSIKKPNLTELIIVNDGSTDDSLEAINKYKNHDNVVIIDKQNGGHGSTVNIALEVAKGKYFRILDSDDLFNVKKLDEFIEYLQDSDSDIIFSDYIEKNTNNTKIIPWSTQSKKSHVFDQLIKGSAGVMLPFVTIKTELIKDIRLTENAYYDDQEYDFWCLLRPKTASYFNEPIYIYNVGNEGQSISAQNMTKHSKEHETICLNLIELLKKNENKLSSIRKEQLKNRIIGLCFLQYEIIIKNKKSRKEFLEFDKKLKKYPEFYHDKGVAGKRMLIHRLTRGMLIR